MGVKLGFSDLGKTKFWGLLKTNYSGECVNLREIKFQRNGKNLHDGETDNSADLLGVCSGWEGLVGCMEGKQICLQNIGGENCRKSAIYEIEVGVKY
jgi:hypothetical protein